MKKTAIALAVTAAVASAAHAQNVTIDGYIDRAYEARNSTNSTRDRAIMNSSAGTTTIRISGSEDLGGGLRVGFSVNTDWSALAGMNADLAASTASSTQTGGFANGQSFLSLSDAKMGEIRLGAPNNFLVTTISGVAQPAFSTGVGSIYSGAYSVIEGVGTGTAGSVGMMLQNAKADTTTAYAGTRMVRNTNTAQYLSPSVNGFQFMAGHALQTDKNGTDDFPGVTEYAVRYTAGALDVMANQANVDIGSAAPANSSLNANSSFRYSALGASFAVSPMIRLHAGMGSSKSANLATNFNSRWNNFGASLTLTPTISAMANISSVNDASSFNMDRGLTGVGLNYALSKRSRAYVRYETLVTDKENKSVAGNKQTITAVGVSHSF